MSDKVTEQTEQHTKQQKKRINSWLKSQKKFAYGKLSRAIALGAINGLLMIFQTAILAYLIDLVIFPSADLTAKSDGVITQGLFSTDITVISTALVIIIFCRAALGYFSECYSRRGAMNIKANIRARLLHRLFQFGPAYTQTKGSAQLSRLLHQGIDSLEDYFAGYLPVLLTVR